MIENYFDAIGRGNGPGRRPLAQFYTAPSTAVMLAAACMGADPATAAAADQDHPPTEYSRIIDPACGAGMLLLEGTRRLHASTGLPLAECVGRVHGGDVDLGAVLTARAVLRSLAPPAAEPHIFWQDAIARWSWRLGRIEVDPTDLPTINHANKRFWQESIRQWPAKSALAWMARHEPPTSSNPDPDPFNPLGTAHVDADGEPTFEWSAEARPHRQASLKEAAA